VEDIILWEYRVSEVGSAFNGPKPDVLEELLNQWGLEGWKVVSVTPQTSSFKLMIVARRPLSDSARRGRSQPR
jgi:hypothetical protein